PFVRIDDRYALIFVPVTLVIAGVAWLVSGEAVRALAVLVVATPCPLILAAPIAIVAGISRAARRGIIVKGGGALEALGRGQVLLFDKTGTLTAGAPEVSDLETFREVDADELLRLAASLDQVSAHVLASAIEPAGHATRDPIAPAGGVPPHRDDHRRSRGRRGVGRRRARRRPDPVGAEPHRQGGGGRGRAGGGLHRDGRRRDQRRAGARGRGRRRRDGRARRDGLLGGGRRRARGRPARPSRGGDAHRAALAPHRVAERDRRDGPLARRDAVRRGRAARPRRRRADP